MGGNYYILALIPACNYFFLPSDLLLWISFVFQILVLFSNFFFSHLRLGLDLNRLDITCIHVPFLSRWFFFLFLFVYS